MTDQQEPEVLWESDRSYGEKSELLRLERGEYQGKPTYTLRLLFKSRDGEWRWSQARTDSKGRCWASLNLKAKELKQLGEILTCEGEAARASELRQRAERAKPSKRDMASPPTRGGKATTSDGTEIF